MKKFKEKYKNFCKKFNSIVDNILNAIMPFVCFLLLSVLVWQFVNCCGVDTSDNTAYAYYESNNPFSGYIYFVSEENEFTTFTFQSNDTFDYNYYFPNLEQTVTDTFLQVQLEPFLFDRHQMDIRSQFDISPLYQEEFSVGILLTLEYYSNSGEFISIIPDSYIQLDSNESVISFSIEDYLPTGIDLYYLTYFDLQCFFIGGERENEFDVDIAISYLSDLTYEDYLRDVGIFLAELEQGVNIMPITDQIVNVVTNFLQIQLLPDFRFLDLVYIALIIPLLIMVLKLWLGG